MVEGTTTDDTAAAVANATPNGSEELTPASMAAKKTKKLQIEKSSDCGRRLVEYFVVVSSLEWKNNKNMNKQQQQGENGGDFENRSCSSEMSMSEWNLETSSLDGYDDDDTTVDGGGGGGDHTNTSMGTTATSSKYNFRPTITARYPLHDHHDNPLHENLTFFCHPTGRIQLRTQEHMPKVHYFVATGGTGKQVYGTCLTLWEPYMLQLIKKKKKKKKDDMYDAAIKENNVNVTTDGGKDGGDGEEKEEDETPTERQVYLPKCLVLLSTYPYLAAFREYLTQIHRLSKLGTMPLPVERYITNFCSEIPAPPPGSFEVQTTILDSVIKIWSPPHNLPIPWVSMPFAVLFECLDIDNIILVWHCMVLERQVLVTSTQLSLLTQCLEILLSLLFPMKWSHAYIPLLPHFLIPILAAPMPFLCGINKTNLADALYDLSRDCVLVDLDKNTVTLGPDTAPLPPLPPFQEGVLRSQLNENVGMVFREARSLTKNDDYSDSGQNLPSHVKVMAEAMWESKLCLYDEAFHMIFTPDEARKCHLNGDDASGLDDHRDTSSRQSMWDAVQEAFLDTMVYLLRNYRQYLVFPSKHNEGSYGGAGFRSKEFIESQRFDMREFLEQFIGTQMFDNFVTKRLYGSGEADVAFFDLAVDRFLKNAGLFANVDLSGRIMDAGKRASETVKEKVNEKRGNVITRRFQNNQQHKRPSRTSTTVKKKDNIDPLLQSAKVHRLLKTIVPPEPTGEGLPPVPMIIDSDQQVIVEDDNESTSLYSAGSRSTRNTTSGLSTLTGASGGGSGGGPSSLRIIETEGPATAAKKTYKYPVFPSAFNAELFGTPRPLPSIVIAEFDRQRKDAAQFRRKAPRKPKESKGHFHRAHSTVDPVTPPSPEVATFTVFFLSFTAMVGKELVDMAAREESALERTILSTYVPTTDNDSDSEVGGSVLTSPTAAGEEEEESQSVDVIDPDEKARVEEMKASRPNMGGMFGDDEDEEGSTTNAASATASLPTEKDDKAEEEKKDQLDVKLDDLNTSGESALSTPSDEGIHRMNGEGNTKAPTLSTEPDDLSDTARSEHSKPRERFTDKLSDLEIEEAKAHGRAQLALGFEMLTMMKKRGLKADPEAYQCLIDASGRVGDTKRATELLSKMHEDGIVADGTVYACLVSAFSADTAFKGNKDEDLPEWANSTAVEMDWNKLQKRSLLDRIVSQVVDVDDEDDDDNSETENMTAIQKLRSRIRARRQKQQEDGTPTSMKSLGLQKEDAMEFYVTETVERQIALGENLLEIVFPDISVDTDNEKCPRCSFELSDDHVAAGWTPDSNDYTTACPNCTQRFVPHFCVQCSSPTFQGSRGLASPLFCERLSPWVLLKEIRSVMSEREGVNNLLSPEWREKENKNAVLWWNLVLSFMRYRFPFSFLLQGSFEQNLIAPMPEDES